MLVLFVIHTLLDVKCPEMLIVYATRNLSIFAFISMLRPQLIDEIMQKNAQRFKPLNVSSILKWPFFVLFAVL